MTGELWLFAVERYARPAVREACLAAQDRCGADVSLLLYLAWLEQQGLARSAAEWQALGSSLADFRRAVTTVRRLRRKLSSAAAVGQRDLLQQARDTELSLEKLQLALIEDWHHSRPAQSCHGDRLQFALLCLVPVLASEPSLLAQLKECLGSHS